MHINETNAISDIYKTCYLLHITSKMNVQFIDISKNSSFQMNWIQIPKIIETLTNVSNPYILDFFQTKPPTQYLFITDTFNLCYLAVGKWKQNIYQGVIIIGPFLFDIPNHVFILNILEKNQLDIRKKLQLENFYQSLTITTPETYSYLGHLMVNLCTRPFIHGQMIFSNTHEFQQQIHVKPSTDDRKEQSSIVLRYQLQNKLSKAVEKGKKTEAFKIYDTLKFNVTHRVPHNPFRAHKNFAYSFNTILRMAIEKGGVHPVYIHNVSDKFAILIEKTNSIEELENLQHKMISDYCDMVKNLSTAGYSPIVRNAIDEINLNFNTPLSLISIAKHIKTNPSHLSRQFKKETKMTITEFINKKESKKQNF